MRCVPIARRRTQDGAAATCREADWRLIWPRTRTCQVSLWTGQGFDAQKVERFCRAERRLLDEMLRVYVGMLEVDARSFDDLPNVYEQS